MGDDQTSIVAAVGSKPPLPPPDKKKNNKLEILLAKHIDMKPPEIYLLSIQEEEEEEVNITTLGGGSQFPLFSCHGLILTLLDSYPEKLAIWNPTTTSKDDVITTIPPCVSPWEKRKKNRKVRVHMYGFGFDPSSIEYKVIRFIDYQNSDNFYLCHFLVEIFSLKTHSSKLIKYPFGVVAAAKYPDTVAHAAFPLPSNTCTCINGFCYWEAVAKLDGRMVIIPFDLATDNFASAFIPGPPDTKLSDFMLAEIGGSLAVVAYEKEPNFEFELWVWNGESSWSLRGSGAIRGDYFPEGFFEDDKLLLHNYETKEVVLFDCAKQKLKNLGFYAQELTIFPSLRSSDEEEIIKSAISKTPISLQTRNLHSPDPDSTSNSKRANSKPEWAEFRFRRNIEGGKNATN